jgi:hypothetical protein
MRRWPHADLRECFSFAARGGADFAGDATKQNFCRRHMTKVWVAQRRRKRPPSAACLGLSVDGVAT